MQATKAGPDSGANCNVIAGLSLPQLQIPFAGATPITAKPMPP